MSPVLLPFSSELAPCPSAVLRFRWPNQAYVRRQSLVVKAWCLCSRYVVWPSQRRNDSRVSASNEADQVVASLGTVVEPHRCMTTTVMASSKTAERSSYSTVEQLSRTARAIVRYHTLAAIILSSTETAGGGNLTGLGQSSRLRLFRSTTIQPGIATIPDSTLLQGSLSNSHD